MWTNPNVPNVADFAAFVTNQGVPETALPSGALTTVSINTAGVITAASSTGTVVPGMALVGLGVPLNTYLATWVSNSGTVAPVPPVAIAASSVSADSPYLQWAFNKALATTLIPPACMPPILYVMAVYNLGMHTLLKIAQDRPGQTFFVDQRCAFKLLTFVSGPVVSSADQGTSNTLLAPDFLKGLTMAGLDLLKTPWGQEYLAYSQEYGPNIVGVS